MKQLPSRQAMKRLFELQCQICKAMSHPLRLEIVELMSRDEIPATRLLTRLGISKANLSKHMNQLVQTGIAEQRREGRQVFYRLTHPEIHDACTIMRNIMIRRIRREEQLALSTSSPRKR
jgi:DNA-binding transcriptional ArsR family regulator